MARSVPSDSPVVERADDTRIVARSRARTARHQEAIVDAARRLITERGGDFTTHDLVREAGVALQTFYRYFAGKDQLLLAVIADLIAEAAAELERRARDLPDPVARLHLYITVLVSQVGGPGSTPEARFVTAEHWRLHQIFPDEVSRATQPVADLIERELHAAAAAGLLAPRDPPRDAWFAMRLVMSVFHHYAFVALDDALENVGESLWSFCLGAFGGSGARPR